jgi:hypothetical protein
MSQPLTLREYASRERITLGTAYRRIWEGKVHATQVFGRWLISPRAEQPTETSIGDQKTELATA